MSLREYTRKRRFDKTPEPRGTVKAGRGLLKFVVQRHEASRLHYDFRIEVDGVLKSWSVPKGPSLDPSDKRLAVHVEDHPYEYRTFEGEIPEGSYGAGTVRIWDEGEYSVEGADSRDEAERLIREGLERGHVKFALHGRKLKGGFALVKMHGTEGDSWLLIKQRDDYAVDGYDSEEHLGAVHAPKRKKSTKRKAKARAAAATAKTSPAGQEQRPAVEHLVRPMLARLHSEPFDDPNWLFEIKFDGYRAVADVDNDRVELYSRNGTSFNEQYPPVVEALRKLGHRAVIDGEIVVLDKNGQSRFQLLQQYLESRSDRLYYYAFDLLELDGHDLRQEPLAERKELLKRLLPDGGILRYSDHIGERGTAFFDEAAQNGLEGIIAKRADSPYQEGVRGGDWLKIKVHQRQEAVICGFTDPRGERRYFGSLVLGVYDNGRLRHVGNCGSGFTIAMLRDLRRQFEPYIRKQSPFGRKVSAPAPITFMAPELVCEVEFGGWTDDGRMRHPIFQGLRIDKDAKEVVRERPDDEPLASQPLNTEQLSTQPLKRAAVSNSSASGKADSDVVIDGHRVTLTNVDKVYWPEEGYSKGDVIAYYADMADYIMPYLADRPQSLFRQPNGTAEPGFFQKNMGDSAPLWAATVDIYAESTGENVRYLVCRDKATLAYMNNLGCIEINPWSSRVSALDCPDYLVIDLDPGDNEFSDVIDVALAVRDVLDRAGAEAYCKTSGATGMHVYVPLGARYSYDEARDFALIVAQLTHESLPGLTSLERSPKARRKQIYLDYLQNRAGQTLASVYSLRPKPGVPVSTPLKWSELKPGLHPADFTIRTIQRRLQKTGDLFSGVLGDGVDLLACLKRLGA